MLSGKDIGLVTVIWIAGLVFIADRGRFAAAESLSSGSSFRDCSDCPEMVTIPAGSFKMGAQPGEEERERVLNQVRGRSVPQHLVNIAAFAGGKYDVTRDEYGRFASETNRPDPDKCYLLDKTGQIAEPYSANWRSPGFTQTSREPVVCISWGDAQAYAAWLSRKTGMPYRLLSESEWEYATRAGTATSRYWDESADDQCFYANGADRTAQTKHWTDGMANCNDGSLYTSPVGSFRANGFGLYDMLGNVWQWTSDCWNANYDGAPSDGSAWATGACGLRVGRGGSWYNGPAALRSAFRVRTGAGYRDVNVGFRVARSFPLVATLSPVVGNGQT
jgi:formylglycine-generating enzyme